MMLAGVPVNAEAVAELADVHPNVIVKGISGHPYRITARAFRPDGRSLLVSMLAPRSRGQIKGVVDRTVRQWVDVNHDIGPTQKVSFLNDTTIQWPAADLRLLSRFSLVTSWQVRHNMAPVLEGPADEMAFETALPLWGPPTTDLDDAEDR